MECKKIDGAEFSAPVTQIEIQSSFLCEACYDELEKLKRFV